MTIFGTYMKTKLTTSLHKILSYNPCGREEGDIHGWNKLVKFLGQDYPLDKEINLLTILESNGIDDFFWAFRAADQDKRTVRKVALECAIRFAQSVLHVFETKRPNDKRPREAIEATQNWLQSPSEENRVKAVEAAKAAALAAVAEEVAAQAAGWAAEAAAWAAQAAGCAAHAEEDAAQAAGWAAEAAAWGAQAAGWAAHAEEEAEAALWAAKAAAWGAALAQCSAVSEKTARAAQAEAWSGVSEGTAQAAMAEEKLLEMQKQIQIIKDCLIL